MKITAVVGSAIIGLVCCSIASAQWPQQTFAGRNWEIEFGTRIVDRPGSDLNLTLIREATTLTPLFSAQDATELGMSAGADVRVLKQTQYGTEWEFRGYFNNWENVQNINGNLRSPLLFGVPLSAVDYAYDSDLYSFEWNLRKSCLPGLSFFCGPRYVHLEDQLLIRSTVSGGLPTVVQTATDTQNPMIGAQVGAELRRPLTRNLFVVANVKAGGYANNSRNRTLTETFVLGTLAATNRDVEERKSGGAFIGEVAARLHYDIVPGQVSFYTGYEASWFDGVAVAPPQVLSALVPNSPMVHTSTTAFVHGLVLGGMVRF